MTNDDAAVEARARKLDEEFEIYLEDILNGKREHGSSWKFFVPFVKQSDREAKLERIVVVYSKHLSACKSRQTMFSGPCDCGLDKSLDELKGGTDGR